MQAFREDMLEDFQDWTPKARNLTANAQKPDSWALFNHLPASTYYDTEPLVCLVGDLAYASTPHQGLGAGMIVEDTYFFEPSAVGGPHEGRIQYSVQGLRCSETAKKSRDGEDKSRSWSFMGPRRRGRGR